MEHANPSQFDATRKSFGAFVLAQVKREDAAGELARVAFKDPRFPRTGDFKAVSKYLNSVGASTDMHEALDDLEIDWLSR